MVRSRALASAIGALVISGALVLAPALSASATDGDPGDGALHAGMAYAIGQDGTSHITLAVAKASDGVMSCMDNPNDHSCAYMILGFDGPAPDSGTFTYLSTYGGNHYEVQNFSPSSDDQISGLGVDTGAADWWVITDQPAGNYAGLTCLGVDNVAGASAADLAAGPCHINEYGQNTGVFGWARDDLDMGAAGGQPAVHQPGEQEDGTINPLQCFSDLMDTADNPFEGALMAPFYSLQCIVLWAITPPTDLINDLVHHQTELWNTTQLGATMGALDFYSAFSSPDSSCAGIPYNFDFLHIPGQKALPKPGNFLAACSGSQLAPVASLVFVALSAVVLIGGVFKITRMISAFIKGPQIDDKPDWEDARLF